MDRFFNKEEIPWRTVAMILGGLAGVGIIIGTPSCCASQPPHKATLVFPSGS
jgi:hypothetical protein